MERISRDEIDPPAVHADTCEYTKFRELHAHLHRIPPYMVLKVFNSSLDCSWIARIIYLVRSAFPAKFRHANPDSGKDEHNDLSIFHIIDNRQVHLN
jgi:hypothetical protein